MNFRRLLKGAVSSALLMSLPMTALAEPNEVLGAKITAPGDSDASQMVSLGANKSMIVELERDAADVVITNPEIADAVVQTARRIVFRGVSYGQTNAFIFDKNGDQILNLEMSIERDFAKLQSLIEQHVPEARVKISGLNGNVVMTGTAPNLSASDAVKRLVTAFVDDGEVPPSVVDMISVDAKDQVLLEVRIVEMQRSAIKQLGINLSGELGFGDLAAIGTTGSFGFPVQGRSLGGLSSGLGYTNFDGGELQSSFGATVDALERVGVVKVLAEPTIVAVSGESGNFLAGGEFPVPVGQEDGAITIEFKPFGVGLGFTPVVLSEERISLKISTEVSELSSNGAFQGESVTQTDDQGTTVQLEGITLPALTVRRAESTVELPSGGSMMMAGLIQSKSRQTLSRIPGLKDVPILGALFQSRDFLNEESELVVIVTPYLVDPTEKGLLQTPDKGFANASDSKTIFMSKLNEQFGDGQSGARNYNAPVGFIEE